MLKDFLTFRLPFSSITTSEYVLPLGVTIFTLISPASQFPLTDMLTDLAFFSTSKEYSFLNDPSFTVLASSQEVISLSPNQWPVMTIGASGTLGMSGITTL